MSKVRISAHTLIKNEQRWIWFAIMSVIDYVDEILVWDTGSTDKTVEIVKLINHPKIKFRECGQVDAQGHSDLRQKMIEETNADWILILDGDEVWWPESISKLIQALNTHPNQAAVISPFYNAVGDVTHLQASGDNLYEIGEHKGAFNIRAINRQLPDLKIGNPHGRQEYRTNGVALQNLADTKLLYVDAPYFHLTHLRRSMTKTDEETTLKRSFKFRYDLGHSISNDFIFPLVFYLPTPSEVPSPFFKRSFEYTLLASLIYPFRLLKKLLIPPKTSGY